MNVYLIAYCLIKALTILATVIIALAMMEAFTVLWLARFGFARFR